MQAPTMMQSIFNMHHTGIQIKTGHEDKLIAGFAALAIGIHLLESALPSPVPGIKPGLANLVTLYVLMQHGWRLAVNVSLLRVLAGSLLLGSFLSPTFALSLAGAVASLAILGLAWHIPRKPIGPVGLAILAALAHMTAQILTAYFLFIPHTALFSLLPVLLTAALISGTLGGILVNRIIKRTKLLAEHE